MNRFRLLLVTAFLFVGVILATPLLIRVLPDRYVFRLPAPLKKFGLPENEGVLLPTAAAPVEAISLLASETVPAPAVKATQPPLVTATNKSASVTSKPGSAAATRRIQKNETIQPTETLAPTPTLIPTRTPRPIPGDARLEGFRHKFQSWNNCGPATLAMALTYFGDQVTQEQTAAVLKPDPEDRNVTPGEMSDYVTEQTSHEALARENGTLDLLKRMVANDIPVIIETGIDPPGEYRWLGWYGHYLLIVAYDDSQDQFWVYDSWLGTSEEPLTNAHPDGRAISYDDLDLNWSQFNHSYIAIFRPDQRERVQEIVGQDLENSVMWQRSLARARSDVELAEENAFSWFNMGTSYAALGQYEEAAIAFDQARAIGLPWRMLWYQFGPYEAYLNVGRFDDVVLLADLTLDNRPYFEEAYYYKGLALEALGEHDKAVTNLEKAARFNPNFEPAALALEELE